MSNFKELLKWLWAPPYEEDNLDEVRYLRYKVNELYEKNQQLTKELHRLRLSYRAIQKERDELMITLTYDELDK